MTKQCLLCSKHFKISKNKRYCGSFKVRNDCAWKALKIKRVRYQSKVPEKLRKWSLATYYRNRDIILEKRRKLNKQLRLNTRFLILSRDNFTCQYCGAKSPEVKLQIDHIIPKSKGGLNEKENYITSCVECNIGKSDCILTEFL